MASDVVSGRETGTRVVISQTPTQRHSARKQVREGRNPWRLGRKRVKSRDTEFSQQNAWRQPRLVVADRLITAKQEAFERQLPVDARVQESRCRLKVAAGTIMFTHPFPMIENHPDSGSIKTRPSHCNRHYHQKPVGRDFALHAPHQFGHFSTTRFVCLLLK